MPKTLEKKRQSFNQECNAMGTNYPFPNEDIFGCKKSLMLRKAELFKNVPQVSAKCWAIYDAAKMSYIHGKREYCKRECASLTKIMTCHVVLSLCK